jgi:hypothetical protein
MGGVNLIHLFDFYLAAMFLLGSVRRFGQYRTIGAIMVSAPGRWPNLLKVMKEHRAVFFTWATVRPALLALSLAVIQAVCSRLIWPQAELTTYDVLRHWIMVPVLIATMFPMLGVDVYFLIRVSRIDRGETEAYLDKAENWLTSWKAPVVKWMTLGYINPQRVVSAEVRKALEEISALINSNLRWMSLQMGLRVLFGLALWLTWALF